MIDIEKVIELFKHHELVKFIIPNCGEREYKTAEFTDVVETLKKQLNNGWIPFRAEYDEDLKLDTLQCEIPDEEQEILVTDGKSTWSDVFMKDEKGWYLDSGEGLVTGVTAWQSLPEPYKEEE